MDGGEEVVRTLKVNNVELLISNLGKVYKDGKELRQNENFDGYLVVYVGNNRSIGVHRLVAMAFIHNDEPETKNEVNHIDFNRKNNAFLNLEWMSHSDNVKYSWKHGRYTPRIGEDNPNFGNRKLSKFYSENPHIALEKQSRKGAQNGKSKSIELYKDGEFVEKFDYIGECCKYLYENYGFSSDAEVVRSGIRRSMKNNRPYKGFTFKK
jgi:hypothetical protein